MVVCFSLLGDPCSVFGVFRSQFYACDVPDSPTLAHRTVQHPLCPLLRPVHHDRAYHQDLLLILVTIRIL